MPHTTRKQKSLKKELVKVLASRTFTPKDLEEAIVYLKDKTTQARILKHASDQKCFLEHFTKTERDLVMKYVDQNSLCIDDVRPKFTPGTEVEYNDGTVIDTVVIEEVHSWDSYFNCWRYKVKKLDGAVLSGRETCMWVEK
jgi:hypothetical protein